MLTPAIPSDEPERLNALERLELLDTPPTERFDRITRLACDLFDAPIALVTLIAADRQWFKSAQGIVTRQTPRSQSFCGHTILSSEVFVVENARRDLRFADNPLVKADPRVRFYAGCPIASPEAYRVGTVALFDTRSRRFGNKEKRQLRDLAALAESALESEGKSLHDELTGLANRRRLEREAQGMLRRCSAQSQPVSLLYFTLELNAARGHLASDHVTQRFAGALGRVFRERDIKARVNRDEFVVVLANATYDDHRNTLDRLDRELVGIATRHRELPIGYNVGFATRTAGATDTLLELLDKATRKFNAKVDPSPASDHAS